MSGYVLQLPEDESVVLSGPAVRRLIQTGDGDAALLYIAVLTHRGRIDDEGLQRELRWNAARLERALTILANQALISRPGGSAPPPPAGPGPERGHQRPEYTRMDLTRAMEGSEFAGLTAAVEDRLGKKLTTPDLGMLLGLYDDVGLPADVIYTLVGFCVERSVQKYGPGRKPTMRQIEQEGYTWARLGLMDQTSAADYINRYNRRREKLPRMMALLGLGQRRPSLTEEKYMLAWSDMGFEDGMIERAYDRTMLKCKELRWGYMNKILTSWQQKGYRTLQDVENGEGGARVRRSAPPQPEGQTAREDMDRMAKYLQQLRQQEDGQEER